MGPALVAFIILIIAAAVGVYIVKSGDMNKAEGFSAESRAAALACEKEYNTCLRDTSITDKSKCQATYKKCIEAIVNPSVSTATLVASSTAGSKSSSAAAAGTLGQNKGTFDASGSATGATLTKYNELYKLLNASAQERGQTADKLASYNQTVATLTPEYKDYLKKVQASIGSTLPDPTDTQLSLAQGEGSLPQTKVTTSSGTLSVPALGGTKDKPIYLTGEQVLALYGPAVQKIKPHQKPKEQLPSYEPEVDDEDETEYGQIQKGRTILSSIRQMIRDDVRDEIDGARVGNPYEIRYDYA